MSDASPVRSGESLILGNGAQLSLIDADEYGLPPGAYARSEDRGRWTGDRLFFANPQVYRAIARLLARGQMTYRDIAETLEISVNTVCGVAYREGVPIETLRERIGRLGLEVAQLSLEAIRDLLSDPVDRKKINAKDLAIIHGIATTNAQLLLGGATARIDTTTASVPDHEAYVAFLKTVTPLSTGLVGGNLQQKEGAPALPVGSPEASQNGAVIDVQSAPAKPPAIES